LEVPHKRKRVSNVTELRFEGLMYNFCSKRKCRFRVKYYLPTKAALEVVKKAVGERKA